MSDSILTAKGARNLVKSPFNMMEMKNIAEKIRKSASEGEYHVFVYEVVGKRSKEQLESLGYKVTDESDRDGTLIRIDWSEE